MFPLYQGRSVPKYIHVLLMHSKAAFNVAGASASRILLGIRTLEDRPTTICIGKVAKDPARPLIRRMRWRYLRVA